LKFPGIARQDHQIVTFIEAPIGHVRANDASRAGHEDLHIDDIPGCVITGISELRKLLNTEH
jgi:hypothetical protein